MQVQAGRIRSSAFTLVELLVVISIIGGLVGLLLPAVQAVRESSRKMQCGSHIKQLGLGLLNFESAHKKFPSGGWGYRWVGYADVGGKADQPGSWTFSILPFIEQDALYHLGTWASEQSVRDRDVSQRTVGRIPIYNCPSRRDSGPFPIDPMCETCGLPFGVSLKITQSSRIDYAVNAGDGAPPIDLNWWPSDFMGPATPEAAQEISWAKPPDDWSGISHIRLGVRFAEITDGSSHMFLLGEKHVNRLHYADGLDWGDNEPSFSGFDNDNHRSTHPLFPFMADSKVTSVGSFGSAHRTGANMCMADGSVHQIDYSIDKDIFRRLGNRRDGEAVELP